MYTITDPHILLNIVIQSESPTIHRAFLAHRPYAKLVNNEGVKKWLHNAFIEKKIEFHRCDTTQEMWVLMMRWKDKFLIKERIYFYFIPDEDDNVFFADYEHKKLKVESSVNQTRRLHLVRPYDAYIMCGNYIMFKCEAHRSLGDRKYLIHIVDLMIEFYHQMGIPPEPCLLIMQYRMTLRYTFKLRD